MPIAQKLRAHPPPLPFRVVLVEPEIPPNTGAIGRTCAATQSRLHLIEPLGFSLSERAVRRAGLDYWPHVRCETHPNWSHYAQQSVQDGQVEGAPAPQTHLFSANATRSYLEATFRPGDALVFGKESTGLPAELLDAHPETSWAIPTSGPVRSLNLSNAVAIVLYHALDRCGANQTTFMR